MASLRSVLLSMLGATVAAATKRDVIMIAVDDMRPELSCYGCAYMHTPVMDALANESVVFDHMYTGLALCAPSRTIFLTSRRPDTSRVWEISSQQYWRRSGGNFTSLPQHFKESGYLTIGTGKIFHPGAPSNNSDAEFSWSPEALDKQAGGAPCPSLKCYINVFPESDGSAIYASPAVHPQNCSADESGEGKLAAHMVSMLDLIAQKRGAGDTRPFFFAAGFHRPHIPWHAPQEFYDLYELDTPLAPHPTPPNATDSLSLNNNWVGPRFNYTFGGKTYARGQGYWTRSFADIAAVPISPDMPRDGTGPPKLEQQRIRQAYRAALSFTDRNIGEVLDAARARGLYNDAIVLLWADHGYQLGDNGQWGKHTDFEHATRIPFMVRLPPSAFPAFRPGRSTAFVENADLMPTLVELAIGGAVPRCPVDPDTSRGTMLCTDGLSFAPVLAEPATEWKAGSFSQYLRTGIGMGYSVRTTSWRYTVWLPQFNNSVAGYPASKQWDNPAAQVEMYQHSIETKPCDWDYEHDNVAGQPQFASAEATLRKTLIAGWRAALPPSTSAASV